jgi:transcriptional regulator with XRE-family HTH domain
VTNSANQISFLSEILEWKAIPEDKLVYFRERLRHKLHAVILDAFLARSKERDLKQSDLAVRIHRKRAQITRWLSSESNLTLDSVSDLMVGLGMDFDSFPFSPIEKTITLAKRDKKLAENAQTEAAEAGRSSDDIDSKRHSSGRG